MDIQFLSRWENIPLDIIKQELDYFDTEDEVKNFCEDPYIYEKVCKDPNGQIWKDLYHRDFTDNIVLYEDETVMSSYLYGKTQIKEALLSGDPKKILGKASIFGYEKILQKLDLTQFDQETLNDALGGAIAYGTLSSVKYLIERGADPHYKNDRPFSHAALFAKFPVLQYLFETVGGPIHISVDKILENATMRNPVPVIKYLLEKGADINSNQGSPLITAVYIGNLPVVKYLIEQGADINIDNEMALRTAAFEKQYETAKYLIDNGANIKIALRHERNTYAKAFLEKLLKEKESKILAKKSISKSSRSDNVIQCQKSTKSGKQCCRKAEDGSQYCWQHS